MELKPTFQEAREWVEQLSSGNYQVAAVMARDMERQMRGRAMPAVMVGGGDVQAVMVDGGDVQAATPNDHEMHATTPNDHEMHATTPTEDETTQETNGTLEQEAGS